METPISMDAALRRLQQAWAEGLHTFVILATQAGEVGFVARAKIVGSTIVAEAITPPGTPPLPGSIAISPADVVSVRHVQVETYMNGYLFVLRSGMAVNVSVHEEVRMDGGASDPVPGKPRLSSVRRR